MPINPSLLIAAPMLQDYLVDKDTGRPLVNGIVSLYKDQARTFYKNWYYQTGTPGAYTWIPLDNPLRLSSVGTIEDPNGNDVIPFYYPFQEDDENEPEKYYVTVYSSDRNGQCAHLQFTRENFPPPSSSLPTPPEESGITNRNYIINNTYWRNIGSMDMTNVMQQVIAPSQHDGYTNGDIQFLKDVNGATDTLTFAEMAPNTIANDITPEFSLNFMCTNIQSGERVKCIQYPISLHLVTLQNVAASLVFCGQNVAGNVNNYVYLYIYQFTGTGALSDPILVLVKQLFLSNSYSRYIIPFIFPASPPPATLGLGGDDALFLRVQYPVAALCNISHTKPQIYLSDSFVPDNDFDTYDQIGAIIDSPRTGDSRCSYNSFSPFGWVPLNDGTIGNVASLATTRAHIDTWPLYNLLWNAVSSPTSNAWCTVTGGLGANAITDFNLAKPMQLPKALSRLLGSAGAGSGLTSRVLGSSLGTETQTLTSSQLPNPITSTAANASAQAGSSFAAIASSGGPGSGVVSNSGGGQPVSIIPPVTFMNWFIKL
jgi:hypothetical protein